jgi:hypothetical protein
MTTELLNPYLIPMLLPTLSMLAIGNLSGRGNNISRAMKTLTEPAERERTSHLYRR